MYSHLWGLRENPFSLATDPAFLYRSTQHEEALAKLIYGVQNRSGFIQLTGEVGTGKTMMLECLRDFLKKQFIEFAFLSNPRIKVDQFFATLARSFDLGCDGTSKTDVTFALNELLLQQSRDGRTTALIIDEAHSLGWGVLEEIRLLGNLEDRRGKLLQVVLAGQPELNRKLDAPNLRQLKQRIVLRCTLQPFNEAQTLEYISTRLERAGMPNQTIFPRDVAAEIHVRSQGIPRLINTVCDNLLLIASAAKSPVITMQMLEDVSEEMRLEWDGKRPSDSVPKAPEPAEPQLERVPLTRDTIAELGCAAESEPIKIIPYQPVSPALVPSFVADSALATREPTSPDPRWQAAVLDQMRAAAARVTRRPSVPVSETIARTASRCRVIAGRIGVKLAGVAQTAIKAGGSHPRWVIALVGVSLIALFSRPMVGWLGSLPGAVSFGNTQNVAAVRPEAVPQAQNTGSEPVSRKVGEESPPRPVRIDPVEYTPEARYARFRGKVVVLVTVDRQGGVANIEFPTPLAFDLDTRVRDAARNWRFKPATRAGKTVESRTLVQVPFM